MSQSITLLSIADKILSTIMLDSLLAKAALDHLHENQCEFRVNHSRTDMVFILRMIYKKFQDKKELFITFATFTKVWLSKHIKSLDNPKIVCFTTKIPWYVYSV